MILVTGATGFVGSALVRASLVERPDDRLVVATRKSEGVWPSQVQPFAVDNLFYNTDWSAPLSGVLQVVHAAARVHVMADKSVDPLAEYRRINVDGTLNLARQAAAAGVERFVFLSSIGVNGAETFGSPYSVDSVPAPHSPYALSKYEAELGLKSLAAQTGMKVVIIRPPLVYGANAPGNFASLMRWLQRGVPLPLGAINNRRSLVSVGNLVDLIMTCLTHPSAANQTFMVSDGEDVSITDLLRRLGQTMGHPARLLPVPESWLKLAAGLLGRADMAQRLCGSLQVDISKTRQLLGWMPPLSLDAGLLQAAQGFSRP